MDSISCKECKKCLFINTLQLIIQSYTKYNMCNLSESIAERAETKGFDKGYNKGTIKTLVDLVKDNLLSIAEASKRANMTEEEFKKYLS